MNIILCGFMGSGKTVVGSELAKIMGRRFVDTDELIEEEQGVAIKAIFAMYGEEHFRDLEYECCKNVSRLKNCVVSTGGGALTFERNVEALKESGKIVLHLKRSAALHGIDELYILALSELFELRGCKRQADGIVVNAEV